MAHLKNVIHRYGPYLSIVNLIRQKEKSPKEIILGEAFFDGICDISETITCEAPDKIIPNVKDKSFSKHCFAIKTADYEASVPLCFNNYDFLNSNHDHLFSDLEEIAESLLPYSGFFTQAPHKSSTYIAFPLTESESYSRELLLGDISTTEVPPGEDFGLHVGLIQTGINRTNCIDCLDRTNINMFVYSKVAVTRQLRSLGVHISGSGLSSVLSLMMSLWSEQGDTVAIQYAGSGAMHRIDQGAENASGEREFVLTKGAQNMLVAAQRYYSNLSSDFERQQSFDILLGIFEPCKSTTHIWEQTSKLEDLRTVKGRRQSDMISAERIAEVMKSSASATSAVPATEPHPKDDADEIDEKIVGLIKPEQDIAIQHMVASAALTKIVGKTKLHSRVDTRKRGSFFDDAHHASFFMTRFEDHNSYSFDTISADNLVWKKYKSTQINTTESTFKEQQKVDEVVQRVRVRGYVEQDLYFGRCSITPEESLYTKYVSLENIPLYTPASAIFSDESRLLDLLKTASSLVAAIPSKIDSQATGSIENKSTANSLVSTDISVENVLDAPSRATKNPTAGAELHSVEPVSTEAEPREKQVSSVDESELDVRGSNDASALTSNGKKSSISKWFFGKKSDK